MAHKQQAYTTPVRTRFTRLGFHLGFIAGFAVLGGALRGFNLLLIVAGVLVGLLIVQWRLARQMIAGMHLQREPFGDTFAEIPFTIRFTVANRCRWLPGWLIVIDDSIGANSSDSARQPAKASCGLGWILPGESRSTHYRCQIERRGVYRLGPPRMWTGFPFGLSTATVRGTSQTDLMYVYPRPVALPAHWDRLLESRVGGLTATAKKSGTSEGDFYGLRQWRHGDSRRWVHWRTTARLNTLAVRQFEQLQRYKVCLILDACNPAGGISATAQNTPNPFEHAVELTAALLRKLTTAAANRVTLVIQSEQVQHAVVTGRRQSILQAMRLLAAVQPSPTVDLGKAVMAGAAASGAEQTFLIVSPRPADQSRLQALPGNLLSRRLDLRWLCETRYDADQQLQELAS